MVAPQVRRLALPRRPIPSATRVLHFNTQVPFSFDERKNEPFIFSTLRTIFLPETLQPILFQQVPRSLKRLANVTTAFPITSGLFVRSFAQKRKLTPLPSCVCALFRRNGGGGAKFVLNLDCQDSLLISSGRPLTPRDSLDSRPRELASRLAKEPRPARNVMNAGRVA
jgi:hypothetical protein